MTRYSHYFAGISTALALILGAVILFAPIEAAAQRPQTPQPAGCLTFPGSINPAACAAWFATGMLTASGYLTWMGGLTLNYAIDITIIKMGNIVNSIEAIQYGWAVLRDIANIGLIFGLLAIGIGMILQISSFGSREVLARLIIIAILLNFSLFITKAIVAVGNSFAIVAYSQLSTQNTSCNSGDACISDKFVEALRLPTIYKSNSSGNNSFNTGDVPVEFGVDGWKILIAGIFGSIFLIITGFVFLAGAILLIIRFVVLVLLMITAPVAWISHILPATDGLWKAWWKSLWKEVFFAPAYLILLLITLYIAQDSAIGAAVGSGGFAEMLSGKTSSVVLVIYFGIITGFMIASLILARKIGSYGSGAVTSFGQKLGKNAWSYARQGAGSATFGLTAATGRNIVGRGALKYAESETGRRFAANSALGRGLLNVARGTGKASFDARRVAGFGKAAGIGEGQKGGYEKTKKGLIDAEVKYTKSLGKGKDADGKDIDLGRVYAEGTLAKRTFLSTIMMRTKPRQKAADKYIEPIKEKEKRRALQIELQELTAARNEKQRALNDEKRKPTGDQDASKISALETEIKALQQKIADKDTELDELKEGARERKQEEKEKPKEEKKAEDK